MDTITRSDPQVELFSIKRRFSREGPGAIDEDTLVSLISRLPGQDVTSLLRFFAASGDEYAFKLIAAAAREDARSEVRNCALTLLSGSDFAESYVDLFAKLLSSGTGDFVAATAVKALGKSDAELTFGLFKQFLTHRDGRVRANCVEGLRYRNVPGFRPVLELLLDDPCARVRAEAALTLWKVGNPVLLQLFEDAENVGERLCYIRAMGRTGRDKRIIDTLWSLYHGDDEVESAAAAVSLIELDPDEALPKMVGMIVYGNAAFRSRVFPLCLKHDRSGTLKELVTQIESLSDAGLAYARPLAVALTLLRDAREVPDPDLLVSLLEHEDPRVCANAIEALAVKSQSPSVRAALIRCLRSGTPRMRVNAAVALWPSGLVSAVSELQMMLDDEDPRIRAGGVYGMGQIGGFLADGAIETMLSDPDESVRSMAARFAGNTHTAGRAPA